MQTNAFVKRNGGAMRRQPMQLQLNFEAAWDGLKFLRAFDDELDKVVHQQPFLLLYIGLELLRRYRGGVFRWPGDPEFRRGGIQEIKCFLVDVIQKGLRVRENLNFD